MQTVFWNDWEKFEYLLNNHRPGDEAFQRAFWYAAENFKVRMSKLLLLRGADPNTRWGTKDGKATLDRAFDAMRKVRDVDRQTAIYLARLFLEHGADPNYTHKGSYNNSLRTAVTLREVDLTRKLLSEGASIAPFLFAACRLSNNAEALSFLLDQAAYPINTKEHFR